MKDVTTYALAHAAILVAALAIAGVLGASVNPAKPAGPNTSVSSLQADTLAVTTMNTPF